MFHYCILKIYYCTPAIYYCIFRKIWELLHSANNRNMVHHTIMSRREILKVVLYFPLTYSKARRSVMLSKKKQFFGSRLKHPSQNKPQNNTRFSFYKKVVYKKVYIKWPKIKKVFIYNILILRNFFV